MEKRAEGKDIKYANPMQIFLLLQSLLVQKKRKIGAK